MNYCIHFCPKESIHSCKLIIIGKFIGSVYSRSKYLPHNVESSVNLQHMIELAFEFHLMRIHDWKTILCTTNLDIPSIICLYLNQTYKQLRFNLFLFSTSGWVDEWIMFKIFSWWSVTSVSNCVIIFVQKELMEVSLMVSLHSFPLHLIDVRGNCAVARS